MHYSPLGSSVHRISRQEYWSRVPFPSPGDLPNPGIEPGSPSLRVDDLPSEPPVKPQMEEGKSIEIEGRLMVARDWLLMNGK